MSIKIISTDFEEAKAIIKDSIDLALFEENEANDVNKFKLLKARELNPDFEYELSLMICGDGDNSFPYRSSYFLTQFFQDLGFDYSHDDTITTKEKVKKEIDKLTETELEKVYLFFKKNKENTAKYSFTKFTS